MLARKKQTAKCPHLKINQKTGSTFNRAEGPHLNNIQLTLVLVVQQQLDKVFYHIAGD